MGAQTHNSSMTCCCFIMHNSLHKTAQRFTSASARTNPLLRKGVFVHALHLAFALCIVQAVPIDRLLAHR